VNNRDTKHTSSILGLIASLWAICGFTLLILTAITRLSAIALDTFHYKLNWYHWAALVFSVVVMAYSEGYKGFQLKFSPRFAARCRHLRHEATWLHTLLAPFFCMGFFHTTRARKIISFSLTLMILGFIQIAHWLPQPWRGILDAGVVTGLAWGLISLFYFLQQAFFSPRFAHSPELPPEH
jgi:hypothetical protein